MKADYTRQNGDSGAPVYVYNSSDGTRKIAGIHFAGSDTVAYFVKVGEIESALGAKIY